jgi:hypothetical protein
MNWLTKSLQEFNNQNVLIGNRRAGKSKNRNIRIANIIFRFQTACAILALILVYCSNRLHISTEFRNTVCFLLLVPQLLLEVFWSLKTGTTHVRGGLLQGRIVRIGPLVFIVFFAFVALSYIYLSWFLK